MITGGRKARVYERAADLEPDFSLTAIPAMRPPIGVLLCAPTDYDVVDVQNPFMAGQAGTVSRAAATAEWNALRTVFAEAGLQVFEVDPLPGREDMVFTANPVLLGLDAAGDPVCVPGRMRFASRQPETAALVAWAVRSGYRVLDVTLGDAVFEGGGDALWHPSRRLLWGGYGPRTDRRAYDGLAKALDVPVLALRLADPMYYHLDTCLCLIDERTCLYYPRAFDVEGRALIRRVYERALEADDADARAFACNAAALPGGTVVIDEGVASAPSALRSAGYRVVQVATAQFMKSGGSVYCMKNFVF
jgi:N-dimethylarginine dimethylaminohydrolase